MADNLTKKGARGCESRGELVPLEQLIPKATGKFSFLFIRQKL